MTGAAESTTTNAAVKRTGRSIGPPGMKQARLIEHVEIRGEGALRAYLRQALMNRIRDELRRRDRRGAPSVLDAEARDCSPSPLEQAIGREALERYERALGRLRESDRDAVIARLELGFAYEEIAATLEKPSTEAARKAVRRAVARLLDEMRRHGIGIP
jgi:RNA polymerase sigma-70 factor (ECF subfamily)